jgi:hypothetical protein
VHKGPDTIKINILAEGIDPTDELAMYQLYRYVSASQAMCRAFDMPLTHSDIGCTRLTVQLDGDD